MELNSKKILVTGGAGFIGSHLVDGLLGDKPDNEVVVVDNLSGGKREYVPDSAIFHEVDILDYESLSQVVTPDVDIVFHLAANSDVRKGAENPSLDVEQNVIGTKNVLEAMRENDVDRIAFTSSSTVYGEDPPLPTPEDYGPLEPISMYGGTKLGCEGLCTAYEGTFDFEAWVFRFANIVGSRCHGVVPDFISKLRDDSEKLEILGDGEQMKSYIHVSDCLAAILHVVREEPEDTFFNIGSDDTISVTRVAEIVSEEMDVDPDFEYTGGDRGWKGDVPRMRLSIDCLKELGWKPEHDSEESVRRATRELLSDTDSDTDSSQS